MPEIGDAIDEVRVEIAAAAAEFMPDLCDLGRPAKSEQGSGHTVGDDWFASDIPCGIVQTSGGVSFHDGESAANKASRLQLPYTATTMSITRQYKVRVHARGVNPQLIFEQPVIEADSMSPLLQISAVLTEGYRAPGIR